MQAREPFNTWSHLVGLRLATAGTATLLLRADRPAERLAFAVYGGTLILLYAASTVYHGVTTSPARLRRLRTLDRWPTPGLHGVHRRRRPRGRRRRGRRAAGRAAGGTGPAVDRLSGGARAGSAAMGRWSSDPTRMDHE